MSYQPVTSPNLYPGSAAVSGITGYKQLSRGMLAATAEVDLTKTAVTGDGEVLMQAFASPAMGMTEIAAGTWTFTIYGKVDSVDGTNEIVIRVYKRTSAGTETELFNTTTGALTAYAALYTVTGAQAAFSLTAATDRLVVKFFAKTTSASTRTIHLYYLGEAHQSRLSLPVELPITPGGDMLSNLFDGDGDGLISASTPAFSGCMLTKSGTQSLDAATFTPITFDGEVYDTDSFHSTSTNTSRMTAPSTGYYLVGGSVAIENLPDAKTSIVTIYKNGSSVNGYGQSRDLSSMANGLPVTHISAVIPLTAGDYVELIGYQNSSGALNCRTSSNGTSFWIMKVG